jgi:hypothetical protein
MARRRLARLALAAAATLGCLLFVEAALRLVGYSYPSFYEPDSSRGWRLRAGEEAWWRREGEALVRINSAGWRDAERARVKPRGAWRLAVVGDSVVEAMQVPLEQTLPQLLERRLAGCPALAGRRLEVLNFGVSGYGTAQEWLTFRHDVLDYSPDAALLVFFAGNDVSNNLRALDGNPGRPYYRLGPAGELTYDNAFRRTRGFRLRLRAGFLYDVANELRLLQLAKGAAAGWRTRSRGAAGADPGADVGLEEPVFRPPRDAAWREAWDVTEALLGAFAETARASKVPLGVATANLPLQAHPDAAVRARAAERLGVDDLDHADRRVAAAATKLGLPVLALAPPLRARAERDGAYLHGFANTPPGTGHWNAAGHAAAAEALAPWICRELAAPAEGAWR